MTVAEVHHLPPVYSPLGAGAIVRAVGGGALRREGARSTLVQHLSATFSAPVVVVTGSGTQALQLAMTLAPPFEAGSAVVALPAYSCFDLVSAAVGAGIRVRFYDVDPVTLAPDMEHLRAVMSEGVSAVVAANLHGFPLGWASIRAECAAHGAFLIEDAAQGLGSGANDAGGGRFGDASVLSFGRGKGWTAGGGGALLVREPGACERAQRQTPEPRSHFGLRSAVVTTAAWTLGRPSLYGLPASIPQLGLGETVYKEPTTPHDISTFSASLAMATAEPAMAAAASRRRVAGLWQSAIGEGGLPASRVAPCAPIGGAENASFLRYPVVLGSPEQAAEVAERAGRLGVARGYPTPLDQLPQAARVRIDASADGLPGAALLAATLVTLPTHRWVTGREVDAVLGHLQSVS